jgi:predicted amidohydrolase
VIIGACQTPEILGDVDAAVACIRGFCEQAEPEGADLLLFPECFLQGYLVTGSHVRRHAFRSRVRPLPVGISMCNDTRFADAAARIARQRARPLLVPAQNMMRRQATETWRPRHNQILADRVRETGMWLVSADVTGERWDTHVGYGPTSVMNPSGEVVVQVPLMETGVAIIQIPACELPRCDYSLSWFPRLRRYPMFFSWSRPLLPGTQRLPGDARLYPRVCPNRNSCAV